MLRRGWARIAKAEAKAASTAYTHQSRTKLVQMFLSLVHAHWLLLCAHVTGDSPPNTTLSASTESLRGEATRSTEGLKAGSGSENTSVTHMRCTVSRCHGQGVLACVSVCRLIWSACTLCMSVPIRRMAPASKSHVVDTRFRQLGKRMQATMSRNDVKRFSMRAKTSPKALCASWKHA